MLFKIAWRNLLKHNRKSLVIGLILLIGSIIMTIGNASLEGMDKGVSRAIAKEFLGDIVIIASNQEVREAVFQPMGESPEILPQYEEIDRILKNFEGIENHLPFAIGFLLILTENSNPMGYPAGLFCIGADLKKYYDYFQNLKIVEGFTPKSEEKGIFINHYMRDFYYQFNGDLYYPNQFDYRTNYLPEVLQTGDPIETKNELIIMGISSKNSTVDLRVPIKGTVHFKNLKTFWREINILDIDSFRQAMNYNTGDSQVDVSETDKRLFSEVDMDSLFEETKILEDSKQTIDLKSLFLDEKKAPHQKIKSKDSNIYHLVAVRTKDGMSAKQIRNTIENLNQTFAERNIAAKATGWKEASGIVGSFVDITRFVLLLVVVIIFFVAIIIIMNTLSISVLDRSKELGMMRAIGARRRLIAKMLLAETFALSAIFSSLGIALGSGIVIVLSLLHLSSDNDFAQLILGGDVYRPEVNGDTLIWGILQLLIVTVLSIGYPLFVSRKISPRDAVSR